MNDAQQQAHDATGRLGLLGHGTYYLLLTLLCARLLVGGGGEQADANGAIATVARQPFGQVLLVALLLAFAAYAVMRWICVLREDTLAERAKNALRGTVWTVLSLLTGNALLHGVRGGPSGGSAGSGGAGGLTQAVLEAPGGQWLVGAAGLFLAGVAVHQFRKATDTALGSELQELGIDGRRAARILGRVGYLGRALAYALVAAFVVHAAWTHDPASATRGLDGALHQTRQSAYGAWLLLAVTIGFAAFGAFRLVEARYVRDGGESG